MKHDVETLLSAILVIACATCVQVHAEEKPANPNVARQATVTAHSEAMGRRKFPVSGVNNGLIQVENSVIRYRGFEPREWLSDGAKSGNESGWLKFQWDEPIEVREIVYFASVTFGLQPWKDCEVYLGDDKTPVGKGSFENRNGAQPIRLDKAHKTKELTLKFTSSHGGHSPGASEVMIFPRPMSKRDLLKALGGWETIASDAFLSLHLPGLGLANPSGDDVKKLIENMEKEFGQKFGAERYKDLLQKATTSDAKEEFSPHFGYLLSPLEKLQIQILLFDENQNEKMVPAFPGAEGFGAYTVGGRGGRVIQVTSLNDSGPGSLREAVDAEGPRTVVFRVSGTIRLESYLNITNPYVTIAGQTAPGDGICLQGCGINVAADQVIIRYLRVRPGDVLGKPIGDAISGRYFQNAIIDHCSMSWTMDEICTFYGLGNVTVQWCLMSESLNRSLHPKGGHGAGHATGGLNLSTHHNLIVSNEFRNPRLGGCGNLKESIVDFRNNVVYNYVGAAYGGEGGGYNFVGNYYKPGPSTKDGNFMTVYSHRVLGVSPFHFAGNVLVGNPGTTQDNWRGVRGGNRADKPFPCAKVTTQTAEEAYKLVLERVGATLPKRDAVDERVIKDVVNRTGKIINSQKEVGGYPVLKTYDVPTDTDHDGMPDDWEREHGLNPNDAADGARDKDADGYTNLEEYLNQTDPG